MTFADALRKHRHRLRITYAELAERVGCSPRWLYRLENGADPKLSLAQRIAAALHFSINDLNGETPASSPNCGITHTGAASEATSPISELKAAAPQILLSACCGADVFVADDGGSRSAYYVCNKCSKVCALWREEECEQAEVLPLSNVDDSERIRIVRFGLEPKRRGR
jgi:transcriptional regulator with XRE-family HTH domain